jgi:hypothetical protein
MHGTSMMVGSPHLRWCFTVLFVLPGLFFLVRGVQRGAPAARVSDGLHVLMCAGMIAMVWPGGMGVPVAGHVIVFGAGTLWFAVLAFVGHEDGRWPCDWGAHAHHAIMMAGMVWMSAIMTLGVHDHAVPSPLAVVAGALAVLFLVGCGMVLTWSSRNNPRRGVPLHVAADVLMSVGMASTMVTMVV